MIDGKRWRVRDRWVYGPKESLIPPSPIEPIVEDGHIRFPMMKIPLIRRVYPSLIANKIVSVQPLTGPTALTYYLRFKYASCKNTDRPNGIGSY